MITPQDVRARFNQGLRDLQIHPGDRIAGRSFATRSTVWGAHGAAATAMPSATLTAIEMLKAGGSAVDAAIAANTVLGLTEPTACGVGGDAFALLWDPKVGQVIGLNGSGRSPASLSLDEQRRRARDGHIGAFGAVSVSTPGAVDAWGALHQRYGKLPWASLFRPAIAMAQEGFPVGQTVSWFLAANHRLFNDPASGVEETDNFNRLWSPRGQTPYEGEVFRNPDLARTYRLIAEGGHRAFYEGEIAETLERYTRRIGGWLSRADLAAHRTEWVEPRSVNYRGLDVWGLPPNGQGFVTLQMLNIMEQFDIAEMGFQTAQSIHHGLEAKRLAFEDRGRFYADPHFHDVPADWLLSKDYARKRAALIRPDRVMGPLSHGQAPSRGDTTYLCTADADGMMVSLIQSNYWQMGSGLVPDGLGFTLQNRGELFTLQDGHPNVYAPSKRPFQTIIPGFATRAGEPVLAFGVMGGDMQPQGQAQVISNLIDHELGLQEAGDAPRWRHYGGTEVTGRALGHPGELNLETGVRPATREALSRLGWPVVDRPGVFGGYQAIQRWPGRYAAASEMRKDGLALAW